MRARASRRFPMNGGAPKSPDWHLRLLQSMSLEPESVRANVISENMRRFLDDYRSFSHIMRNLYGYEIKEDKLESLLEKFPQAYDAFKKNVDTFLIYSLKYNSLRSLYLHAYQDLL